ncbi:hypothetical protein HanPSC8_Chr16g0731031 [Helianthus annuus]|nr:hypothetical protein HanPSC8_Chr16g0731031 [Helianthus annuus]
MSVPRYKRRWFYSHGPGGVQGRPAAVMKTGTRVWAGIPQLICLQDDVPMTCNGHAVRVSPQTQRQQRLWLIFPNIGSRSYQNRLFGYHSSWVKSRDKGSNLGVALVSVIISIV